MSDERWKRIKELAAAALEQAPEKRAEYIAAACGDDTQLAADVDAHIAAMLSGPAFLKTQDPSGDLETVSFGTHSRESDPASVLQSVQSTGRADRYQVRSRIGRGGQGAVYEVWDEDLRRRLAMKVVLGRDEVAESRDTPPIDAATLSRFLEEAQVTGQLDHPGVVPVHELGLDPSGQVYFTMRLVRGDNLERVIEKVHNVEDGWSQVRALGALLKACDALAYAHSKRVIHRDLKPSNLMVGKYGEVYVMDWGLARVLDTDDSHDLRLQTPTQRTQSLQTHRRDSREDAIDSPLITMDGLIVGTPSYMPPEQAEGRVEAMGPASDVYSMGAILYQIITGQIPYVPSGGAISPRMILMRVLDAPPTPLIELAPEAPQELVAVCDKAMARSIEDRYSDMEAFADDLRAFLEGRVVSAFEGGALAEARKWIARNRGWASATGVALIFLLALFAWALVERDRANDGAEEARQASKRERDAKEAAVASEQKALVSLRDAQRGNYESAIQIAAAALGSGEVDNIVRDLEQLPSALRNWEWYRLRSQAQARASADSSLRLSRPAESSRQVVGNEGLATNVRRARWAPSATCVAWAAPSGVALLRHDQSRQLLQHPEVDETACPPAWSADGRRVAVLCVPVLDAAKPKLTVWQPDSTNSEAIQMALPVSIWEGESSKSRDREALLVALSETRLHWSPDATQIAVATAASSAVLALSSGSVSIQRDIAAPIAWSPDGSQIIGAQPRKRAESPTGNTVLWCIESNNVAVDSIGSEVLRAIDWHPDGKSVAAGMGNTVAVWQPGDAATLRLFPGHEASVAAIDWSPNGTRLVSIDRNSYIRLWSPTSGLTLLELGALREDDIAWSSEGGLILASGITASLHTNRLEEAQLLWKQATRKDPPPPALHDKVTDLLDNATRPADTAALRQSLQLARAAVDLYPEHTDARLALAWAWAALGRRDLVATTVGTIEKQPNRRHGLAKAEASKELIKTLDRLREASRPRASQEAIGLHRQALDLLGPIEQVVSKAISQQALALAEQCVELVPLDEEFMLTLARAQTAADVSQRVQVQPGPLGEVRKGVAAGTLAQSLELVPPGLRTLFEERVNRIRQQPEWLPSVVLTGFAKKVVSPRRRTTPTEIERVLALRYAKIVTKRSPNEVASWHTLAWAHVANNELDAADETAQKLTTIAGGLQTAQQQRDELLEHIQELRSQQSKD